MIAVLGGASSLSYTQECGSHTPDEFLHSTAALELSLDDYRYCDSAQPGASGDSESSA
jgi:hypothetical protein